MPDFFEPDSVYLEGELVPGVVVGVEDGKISHVGDAPHGTTVTRMQGLALLPAFVNCHSHAFQIGLRGKGQGDDFWGWRENMYSLVESLGESDFYELCFSAFSEMRARGIATVAEFHYLHHISEIKSYQLDRVLIKAAEAAGIRLVLLCTFYAQAGVHGEPLHPGQRRFDTGTDVPAFLAEFEKIRGENQSVHFGIAAHSVRAVDFPAIKSLHAYSKAQKKPFHIHVEEQQREVAEFQEVYGDQTPIEKLLTEIEIDHLTTFVHCTQSEEKSVEKFTAAGGTVCMCPSTEANLADGIPRFLPNSVSIGSDSNVRIDFLEELRWLEYGQRLTTGQRGNFSSAKLLRCATLAGARSLGLPSGEIKIGNFADFISVEIKNISDLIFSCATSEIIRGTCVAGKWAPATLQSPAAHLPAGDDPVALTFALCAISSVSGEEGAVNDALTEFLRSRGWHVELQPVPGQKPRSNIFAYRPGQRENLKVLFNSHTDTVPPFFPPELVNGQMKGRGVADAKGQVALQILAAERIVKERGENAGVGLLFVVSEETDHSGMKIANDLKLKPRWLVCGEPTKGKVVTMQKGLLKIRVKAQGIAAHSGYPHLGRSAVHELISVLGKLTSFAWPADKQLGNTDVNVGLITGGQAANALAESAEAVVLFRLISDPAEIIPHVQRIVNEGAGVTVEVLTKNPPVDMRYVNELLPLWSKAVACFNTDIPYLSIAPGRPVLFGMGDICDCHCPREYADLADLKQGVELNAALGLQLLSL